MGVEAERAGEGRSTARVLWPIISCTLPSIRGWAREGEREVWAGLERERKIKEKRERDGMASQQVLNLIFLKFEMARSSYIQRKFVEQIFEKREFNTTPSGDQNDMSPRKFLKSKMGKNLRQR
jgi:hypothetical protein